MHPHECISISIWHCLLNKNLICLLTFDIHSLWLFADSSAHGHAGPVPDARAMLGRLSEEARKRLVVVAQKQNDPSRLHSFLSLHAI